MKTLLILAISGLIITLFISNVYAQTLSTPTITSPSSGSSFNKGSTFTLTASVSCSGAKCNGVQLTANLPSGLSTSTGNPQGCGALNPGETCTKSWTVSVNSVGTYSITVTASAANAASTTSDSTSITVNPVCGDNVCEGSETSSTCSQDCAAPTPTPTPAPSPPPSIPVTQVTITIENPKENRTFKIGDTIFVKVKASTSSRLIAELNQIVELFDDGEHGDEKLNDGIYANNLTVPVLNKSTYNLTVKTDELGKQGETYVKIVVDPTLKILLELKKEYSKGSEILFSGKVIDVNNKSLPNATLNISLNYLDFWKNLTAKADENGNFSQNYYIGFLDSEGNWSLRIDAKDKLGNSGFLTALIPVKTPPEAAFYYIKFTNPLVGLSYSRGDEIPISVEVSEGDKPISNANLSFRVPSGKILELKEILPGIYTGEYFLGFDDPYGNYTIEVFGYKIENKTLKGGSNKISLTVKPANLKVELLSPQAQKFTAGQTVKISTRILYPDGTLARNLIVEAASPLNEPLSLSEIEPGIYQAIYKLKKGEEGPWLMQLETKDTYDNSASMKQLFQIAPITIFYFLLTYWYFVVSGLLPFAYLGYRFSSKYYQKSQVKRYTEELIRIKKMKKDAQTKYYKEGSINRETYENLLEEYEKRQEEIKSKLVKTRLKK